MRCAIFMLDGVVIFAFTWGVFLFPQEGLRGSQAAAGLRLALYFG
jgi:hypothetical protein